MAVRRAGLEKMKGEKKKEKVKGRRENKITRRGSRARSGDGISRSWLLNVLGEAED